MNAFSRAETALAPPRDALELSMTLAMARNTLPPLSPMVPKVLALKGDKTAGIADLAKVISSDPTLAARLIGMANAACYGGSAPLVRVHDALMRLGFVTACDMAVSVAVSSALPVRHEFRAARRDLWLHSLGVALCARELAKHATVPCNADAAYLAGFLHDIGYLAIIALWPDTARQLLMHLTKPDPGHEPDYEWLYDSPKHGAIGGELCKLWELPEEIWLAVWDHDDLAEDQESINPLDALIALAHRATDGVLRLKHEINWRPVLPLGMVLDVAGVKPGALDEVRSLLELHVDRLTVAADAI
jgi:HD-like signal output (HDOD) protein